MFDIQIENGGVWVTEQCLRLFYHGAVTLKRELFSRKSTETLYRPIFGLS